MKTRVVQDELPEPQPAVDSTTTGLPEQRNTVSQPALGGIRGFIAAHQLAVFTTLTIVLSWWRWPLWEPGSSNGPIEPFGPAIAAFIVVAVSGNAELRRFARTVVNLKASPAWLVAAVLTPIVMVVAAVTVNTMLGAPAPTGSQLAGWTELPVVFLGMFLFVGLGEEIGWTAFGAPRALNARHFLVAAAILTGIRSFWHLPVLMTGELQWVMVIGTVAFQILILWMYRRSGGRWFPAALFHATVNTVGGPFFFGMVEGPDLARLATIFSIGYALLAIAVLLVDRRLATASATGAELSTSTRH
jgi:membrane protease YdiL (CAAX protease family)